VKDKLGRLETSTFINHNSVILLLNQEEWYVWCACL